ncbi:MAG: hypothetical protein AB1656_01745 [Candidatus Omnitrophota bacterium]
MPKSIVRGNVVLILDSQRLVINRGAEHGVSVGDRFYIYQLGQEITDPVKNASLGEIEWIKAEVEAINVQEKMTLVMSLRRDRPSSAGSVLSSTLAQTHSGVSAASSLDRENLSVRQDQISGSTQLTPIAIGDCVRSVRLIESVG